MTPEERIDRTTQKQYWQSDLKWKRDMREAAMSRAADINRLYSARVEQQLTSPHSVATLINDAEKIFQWLIKEDVNP